MVYSDDRSHRVASIELISMKLTGPHTSLETLCIYTSSRNKENLLVKHTAERSTNRELGGMNSAEHIPLMVTETHFTHDYQFIIGCV